MSKLSFRIFVGLLALCSSLANAQDASTKRRTYQDLWIPEVQTGSHFNLTLNRSSKSFWKGATTPTLGYNQDRFWGPTLIFNKGDQVQIDVTNNTDEETTAHWHGLHVPAAQDGGPHQVIKPGRTWSPSFKVMNNAGTFWYHPHAHGLTQKQITLGAGGFLIIKDQEEAKLDLPRTYGVDDIPLALTSRRFQRGTDKFTHDGDNDKYGDYELVNGTLDAQVKVPAQMVRLRLLNVEIERGYELGFSDNRTFYMIATDGGLVKKPVPLKRIMLMPGERTEILVDLSKDAVGSSLDLRSFNYGHPFGFPGGENQTSGMNGSLLNNRNFNVLHLNVEPPMANAVMGLPDRLASNRYWTEADVTHRRSVNITDGQPGSNFTFDNESYSMHKVNQTVRLGAVEEWTINNNEVFGHAFHVHDVHFNIISRSSGPVPAYEQGWKDTLYIPRGESVSFIAKFEDFAGEDPYMYHCHMSNHEDDGLMGEFVVSADPNAIQFKHQSEIVPRLPEPQISGQFLLSSNAMKSLGLQVGAKPMIVYFIELECPCSLEATKFFNRFSASMGGTVSVVGVVNGSASEAKQWKKEAGAQFTIISDPKLDLIREFGAKRSVMTAFVTKGGRVEKLYPGYNRSLLADLNARVSKFDPSKPSAISFADAPKNLILGCSFPIAQKIGSSGGGSR